MKRKLDLTEERQDLEGGNGLSYRSATECGQEPVLHINRHTTYGYYTMQYL